MSDGPYRDGRVHVLKEKCGTCIFRPGNLMRLSAGRVRGMVADAKRDESAITCHSTLYEENVEPAVCRGFFDAHKTRPLALAEMMGLLEEDEVPAK